METANAHFQVKTNLQDALSGDIHYKVMQRSKNRNKTGYLRHGPTHTHTQTHASQATWYTQTHTLMMTTWFDCLLDLFLVSFCTVRVRQERKRTLVLNALTPCTVWAEEAATWWTPSVIFRRRTSGRRRATKHVGWAWSLKQGPNTSRLINLFLGLDYEVLHVVLWQRAGEIAKDNGLVHCVVTINITWTFSVLTWNLQWFIQRGWKMLLCHLVGLENFREVALHDPNLISALTADMLPLTT